MMLDVQSQRRGCMLREAQRIAYILFGSRGRNGMYDFRFLPSFFFAIRVVVVCYWQAFFFIPFVFYQMLT